MSVDFQKSETREHLMRAFAGESQARNRYTFAARQARSQKLPVIEAVFAFTAEQERAHAKIFYDHLKQLSGTTIHVDGGYPVDIYTNMDDLLKLQDYSETLGLSQNAASIEEVLEKSSKIRELLHALNQF